MSAATDSNQGRSASGHEILPQARPFVFVDRVIELEPGKRAVGVKNVTYNEAILQGNFPERPVLPSSLILEALAQTADIARRGSQPGPSVLVSVKVAFHRVVIPGDQLRMTAEAGTEGKFRVKAEVAGKVVADGEIELG